MARYTGRVCVNFMWNDEAEILAYFSVKTMESVSFAFYKRESRMLGLKSLKNPLDFLHLGDNSSLTNCDGKYRGHFIVT